MVEGSTIGKAMSIGELAQRTGVPVATIRTWEQRYDLPAPARSEGGHRRYGAEDLLRITAVRKLVDQGATVSAAAKRVAGQPSEAKPSPAPPVPLSAGLDAGALEAAYSATRALLRIRRPAQAVRILIRLVEELGGEVVDAAHAPPDALPLDISFGERAPLLPVAEPFSLARLHLERVLPTVLDDARHMVLVTRRLDAARDRGVSRRT
ncbi:MAG: MerR family transcriptional regulator [Actinomycetota bacterium]|nr:MerR family transcriptional regulator [Actinomycetota bacterium]